MSPSTSTCYKIRHPLKADFSNLELVQRETPQPTGREVLVRIKAVSLNARDAQITSGRYPAPIDVEAGRTPVSDGAGEVVAIGDQVKRVEVGDRVLTTFTQGWLHERLMDNFQDFSLGGGIDGCLSEYFLCDQDGLVHTPKHLTDVEACTLVAAQLTAWNSLYEQPGAFLLPGQTVLVLGTGGVSIGALQLAVASGARVIATSSSDEKLERAKKLGAFATINYKTHPEWHEEVKKITNGEGVDHVIEVGGRGTFLRSLKSVKMGGFVGIIGYMSDYSTTATEEPVDYAKMILYTGARVSSIFMGSRDMLESMIRFIETVQMKPVVDKVFAYKDAVAAFKYLDSGSHFGKVVIEVA